MKPGVKLVQIYQKSFLARHVRPSSPTQSHSHSQAQSREVLSDSSTPIAENWCVTRVRFINVIKEI